MHKEWNAPSLRDLAGFNLVELIIVMGLSSILALGIMTIKNTLDKTAVSGNVTAQADSFRKEILNLLKDKVSWKYTLQHNSTFDCVNNTTDCAAAANNGPNNQSFLLYKLSNAIGACVGTGASAVCNGGFDVYMQNANLASPVNYYSFASSTTAGFTQTGSPCSTFPGSPCSLRMVLWWVPVCPNDFPSTVAVCYAPAVHVKGYMLYLPTPGDDAHTMPFNPAGYGIDIILPPIYN